MVEKNNIIDCSEMNADEVFFVLYNSIGRTVKLIFSARQKESGALICALNETIIKHEFKV